MRLLSLLLTLALWLPLQAQTLTGKVIKVADGDTFTVLYDDKDGSQVKSRIRIDGIDAPESGQDYGTKAKERLSSYIFGQEVTLEVQSKDQYSRLICKVFIGRQDIGLQMIKDGLAWHYSYFNKEQVYADAEKKAREDKTGLWAGKDPINPYDYRKQKKNQTK